MNSPSTTQRLFLRYVLGDLPPDERQQVDESLIVDQEFSDSFQEARYDLIDAYVANELTPDVRRQVEQAIFSGEHGSAALSLAMALQRGNEGEQSSRPFLQARPTRQNEGGTRRRLPLRMLWIAAAVAACFLGTFLFVRFDSSGRRPVAGMQGPATHGSASRRASVMAFAMPMGTVRGTAAIPLEIPPDVARIQVQWPLRSDSAAPNYTLEIFSGSTMRAAVPQQGALLALDKLRVANFLLAAKSLPDGAYLFRLRATNRSGNTPVAENSVQVFHRNNP